MSLFRTTPFFTLSTVPTVVAPPATGGMGHTSSPFHAAVGGGGSGGYFVPKFEKRPRSAPTTNATTTINDAAPTLGAKMKGTALKKAAVCGTAAAAIVPPSKNTHKDFSAADIIDMFGSSSGKGGRRDGSGFGDVAEMPSSMNGDDDAMDAAYLYEAAAAAVCDEDEGDDDVGGVDDNASESADDDENEGSAGIIADESLRMDSTTVAKIDITPYQKLELALLLALSQDLRTLEEEEAERLREQQALAVAEEAAFAAAQNLNGHSYFNALALHRRNANKTGGKPLPSINTTDEVNHRILREMVKGMGVPFRHLHPDEYEAAMHHHQRQGAGPQRYHHPPPTSSSTTTSSRGKVHCLNMYNEVKDVAQHVLGLVAQQQGMELGDLYCRKGIEWHE